MNEITKGYNVTIQADNFSLSYDDIGKGKAPVIFLHGYPFDKSMWKTQLDFLNSSFRVIACDIRGFGKSTDEKTPLNIDLFGDDLIRFMDDLNIKKAIVCGLSMGGYIALNVVSRFPDRIKALILCDTQCIADTKEGKEKRYKVINEIESVGAFQFLEKFIQSVFHKDSLVNKKDTVEALKRVVFSNSKHILKAGLAALAERSETCTGLQQINVPTLIICGKEDTLTPVAQSEFMHKNIKGSVLKVIENAGHVSNLEQPDEFNKHLLGFVSALKGVAKR